MSSRVALITGIHGQDGSYLAQLLLDDGYSVFGTSRPGATSSNWRLRRLGIAEHKNLNLIHLDITSPDETTNLIKQIQPDEIYNLASHSYVADSQTFPQQTTMVTAVAPINILESISQFSKKTRFFQAGSSEMFGAATSSPQNEDSDFHPRNIYGSAKVFAQSATVNYRETKGIFSASGILFNHESPLRGEEFVTRKITRQVAKIKSNQADQLKIGNLSALRDWGYAPEYVEAMRLILAHTDPETFVLSSGVATSVRDFVKAAFSAIDMDVVFEGQGLEEVGFDRSSGRQILSIDPAFYREAESVTLVGDPSKAERVLGWKAETQVWDIVRIMVEEDLVSLNRTDE
jgi:GDPmannose 4,6-dehydratase